MGFFGNFGSKVSSEKNKGVSSTVDRNSGRSIKRIEIGVVHEIPKQEAENIFSRILDAQKLRKGIMELLVSSRSQGVKKIVTDSVIQNIHENLFLRVLDGIFDKNVEITSEDQLKRIVCETLQKKEIEHDVDNILTLELDESKVYELKDIEKSRIGSFVKSFIAASSDQQLESSKITDGNKKEADKKTKDSAFKKISLKTERLLKNISDADLNNIADRDEFIKPLSAIMDRLAPSEKDKSNGHFALKKREIEKAWILKKREHFSISEEVFKRAKSKLGNVVRDELRKRIEKKNFKNVSGKKVKNGTTDFADADVYLMGNIVAQKVVDDDAIIFEIIETESKGNKWEINLIDKANIDKYIDRAFHDGKMDKAALTLYEYRTVESLMLNDGNIKSMISQSRVKNGLPSELEPGEKRILVSMAVKYLETSHDEVEEKFLQLRKNKSDAYLNASAKKAINKKIKDFFEAEFLNKGSNDVIIKAEDVFVEKKEALEISNEQKEKLEYYEENLIKAIHEIRDVVGDDMDIDFIPAEKHIVGNLKQQMESLLNRSGHVQLDPISEDVFKYQKELEKYNALALEILGLKQKGAACIIHDGNTFFILKKEEKSTEELENVAKNVIGEKYLKAFIFGIEEDYQKYMESIMGNPEWKRITLEKQQELLEKGVVYYVDEMLEENPRVYSEKEKEDIYKYAFLILLKKYYKTSF